MPHADYACPDCHTPLVDLRCSHCGHRYAEVDGFPVLFPHESRFAGAAGIGSAYDGIYASPGNPWAEQGRTEAFLEYFAGLLNRHAPQRLLEIGCGEGSLLSRLRAPEKCAIDLSVRALAATRRRTEAQLSIALAEKLPFPSASFDLVTGVGVMEHFLDDAAVAREVQRVLRPGGRYVTLLHVEFTAAEVWRRRMREYVFPRPRPAELVRRLVSRRRRDCGVERRFPKQPIQNRFTLRSAQRSIESGGLTVRDVLHTGRDARLPFVAPYVVAYVAEKRAA